MAQGWGTGRRAGGCLIIRLSPGVQHHSVLGVTSSRVTPTPDTVDLSSKLPEYACFFHVSGPSAKNAFAIYFWSKLNHSSRLSLGLTSSRKPSPHLVSHCFGDFFTQSCHCRSLGPCSPTIP